MHREEVRSLLQAIINDELDEDFPTLADSLTLNTEIGMDSMDMVSVVMRIEQKLRIRLAYEELARLATVGELLDLVESKLKAPVSKAA